MITKLTHLLRWILVIPLMVIAGSFVNLTIVSVLSLFGEELMEILYIPLEYVLLPGIIGFIVVRYGMVIMPGKNIRTVHRLLTLFIVFQLVTVYILAPNTELTKDFTPAHLQSIKAIFGIVGGIIGILAFKRHYKQNFTHYLAQSLADNLNKNVREGREPL